MIYIYIYIWKYHIDITWVSYVYYVCYMHITGIMGILNVHKVCIIFWIFSVCFVAYLPDAGQCCSGGHRRTYSRAVQSMGNRIYGFHTAMTCYDYNKPQEHKWREGTNHEVISQIFTTSNCRAILLTQDDRWNHPDSHGHHGHFVFAAVL